MKDGLIRLKVNINIFYDSVIKQYRYRMHCPECGTEIQNGCRCYNDLDILLMDIDDGIADFTCSAKCCLARDDWDELGEAMQTAGLNIDYKDLSEEQSQTVLDILTDGADFESPGGEECAI